MGFADLSTNAGLDRESPQEMVTETLLTGFRVEYLARYAELHRWVSLLIFQML